MFTACDYGVFIFNNKKKHSFSCCKQTSYFKEDIKEEALGLCVPVYVWDNG